MPILQIEHRVHDFATWKAAFDSDPAGREAGGVRRYTIFRPVDDAAFIAVDLAFDTHSDAETFKRGLEELWRSSQAGPLLVSAPRARIVDAVETREI